MTFPAAAGKRIPPGCDQRQAVDRICSMNRFPLIIFASAALGLAGCSSKDEKDVVKTTQPESQTEVPVVVAKPPAGGMEQIRKEGQKIPGDQWLALLEATPKEAERAELMALSAPFLAEKSGPILRRGMRDAAPAVRNEAIRGAVITYADLKLDDVLLDGVADSDPEVRRGALDGIESLDSTLRLNLYSKALEKAAAPDARIECINGLGRLNSKPAMAAILQGSRDLDEKSISSAVQAASLLLSQSFPNFAAASQWWESNNGNYDDNLNLIR